MWRKSNGITCVKPFVSDDPHLPSVFYDIVQPVTLSAFVLVIIIMMEVQPHAKVNQPPPLPLRPDGNIPKE